MSQGEHALVNEDEGAADDHQRFDSQ
jgi:hypothetical protein